MHPNRPSAGIGPARLSCAGLLGLILFVAACGEPPVLEPAQPTATEATTGTTAASVNTPTPEAAEPAGPPALLTTTAGTTEALVLGVASLPADAPAEAQIAMDITPGRYGGQLVIPAVEGPRSFNPIFSSSITDQYVSGLQFSPLYDYDWYHQQDRPALARSWEFDKASLTWTFHLREGVKWSDGQPLTARDFLIYTELLFDPEIPNSERFFFQTGEGETAQRYEFAAPDELTFTVRIPEPDAFSFQNIGLIRALPRHVIEPVWRRGAFKEDFWSQGVDPAELVVSGPFKLTSYRQGEALTFEPNPHYWRYDRQGQRLPYLERLVMLIVEDMEAMNLRFLSGETDLLESIKPENLNQLQDQAQAGNFTIHELGPSLNTTHYFFNLHRGGTYLNEKGERVEWEPERMGEEPPASLREFLPYLPARNARWFMDPEFRRACSEATNRQRMIDNILYGLGAPLYGPVPASNRQWHNPDIPRYAYNPDSARARLDALGFVDRDGDGFREDDEGHPIRFSIVTNRGNDLRERVVQLLREDLRAVGLEVETRVLEFNNLITVLKETFDYDACLLGLGTGVPPHPAMGGSLWRSDGEVHPGYPEQKAPQTEWEAELDRLYAAMKRTFDPEEQRRIFFRMQEIYAEMQPSIHLFTQESHVATRNGLGNLKPTIIRSSVTHNVDELYWEAP